MWFIAVHSGACSLGALIAHRHWFAPPRCRTAHYCRTFVPLAVFIWNDLADLVFDGVGLTGFTSRANALLLAYSTLFVPDCFVINMILV